MVALDQPASAPIQFLERLDFAGLIARHQRAEDLVVLVRGRS
jgi:hypothetical protein